MKIVFMGTPDFAVASLDVLNKSKHEVVAVISQPDRKKGRGMQLCPSQVKEYALNNKLDVYTTENIKQDKDLIDIIKSLKPDVICVVAFGQILSKEILEIPQKGCINVHGSLLPKYRGAAPIQWAVINGDKTTGVTTMYMNEGLDTGDMILKKEVIIAPNETTGELFERLATVGAELLVDTLELIQEGKDTSEKQGDDFTIAPMISKEMSLIDWSNQNSNQIKNLVRGLNPIMGAKVIFDEKTYKLWKVEIISKEKIAEYIDENIEEFLPGQIILQDEKQGLFIKTIDGMISVLEIQGPNSKKMNIKDFLRGNKI